MDKVADAPEKASAPAPEHHLVVIHPFGNYRRGDTITEYELIEAVKAGENAHHCHKVFPK